LEVGKQHSIGSTEDMNGFKQEGIGPMDMTIKDGKRWSASSAYLNPVRRRFFKEYCWFYICVSEMGCFYLSSFTFCHFWSFSFHVPATDFRIFYKAGLISFMLLISY